MLPLRRPACTSSRVSGSPVATYTGGVAGLTRTKPALGDRVDSRSPAAKAYAASLVSQHNAVLSRAQVAASAKSYRHTTAFNGLSRASRRPRPSRSSGRPVSCNVWADEIRTTDTIRTRFPGPLRPDRCVAEQARRGRQGRFGRHRQASSTPESGPGAAFAALPEPRPDASIIAKKWKGTCDTGENNPVTMQQKRSSARGTTGRCAGREPEFLSPRDY